MQQGPLRQSDQLPVRIQNAGEGELLVETGNAQHARTVSRSPSSSLSFYFYSVPTGWSCSCVLNENSRASLSVAYRNLMIRRAKQNYASEDIARNKEQNLKLNL